jgi:hypothetical protein
LPEKTTPRRPKKNPPGRLSKDFRIHKLEKMFTGGEGNKKCAARQFVLHVRSEVKLKTFVNSALFCFTKGLF